ncbi:MAG: aminoglycoside phosphotransferase family protein, partial [Armatimonadota bacterium]|nr:aminoglycoside phosphotransferase family protein [Armatimonadota bacterium]
LLHWQTRRARAKILGLPNSFRARAGGQSKKLSPGVQPWDSSGPGLGRGRSSAGGLPPAAVLCYDGAMPAPATLPPTIRLAVESGLSERFGGTVRMMEAHNFPPFRVFRCTLQVSADAAPGTVIVRLPREEDARSEAVRLDHERAALNYLAAVGGALTPRFFAGGADAGFLVSEDLGPGPSLLDLLLGQNPETAILGTLAFARGLGALHAQTARIAFSGEAQTGLPRIPVLIAAHWRQVQEAVAALGLPAPSPDMDRDIAEISRVLAESQDCFALSSGDPSVVNCKIINGSIRFFDFEEAGFRHALCDAAVLRFFYPTGGPAWRLPPEITRRAEAAYRAELARACPSANSDSRYEAGMAAACAAWMIVRLARLARVDAGPDRDDWPLLPPDWVGPVPTRSRRQQLVSILETGVTSMDCAHGVDFGALTAWCVRLTNTLRARWPEATETCPQYPAFTPQFIA